MDFSKFKTSDWLKMGGAAGFLVFGWLNWQKSDFGFGGTNFTNYFFTGIIPFVLIVGAGIVTFLIANGTVAKSGLPWPLILLAATALGAVLLLLRVLFNPIGCPVSDCGVSRGIGQYLSLISGAVAAVGGFLGFKESGGDLGDLTDVDKLKSAFSQGGGSTPPPPPGMTPPPPPPPPGGMTPPPPPPPPAG